MICYEFCAAKDILIEPAHEKSHVLAQQFIYISRTKLNFGSYPIVPGRVVQWVINVSGYRSCLTADPGVTSSIPARSHTFVEIDHEIIISMVILLPSAESFKKGC